MNKIQRSKDLGNGSFTVILPDGRELRGDCTAVSLTREMDESLDEFDVASRYSLGTPLVDIFTVDLQLHGITRLGLTEYQDGELFDVQESEQQIADITKAFTRATAIEFDDPPGKNGKGEV